MMFQAVEIDGEAYWDGGYSGNPTMTPLIDECVSDDTIIVGINPVERPGTPKRARDILNRLNEVSFNAVLLKELQMMALLRSRRRPRQRADGALGAHARAPGAQRRAGGPRRFVQAQRRMGLPDHAARRGPARGRRLPRRRMATRSASARRCRSNTCWRRCDAMGLLGILRRPRGSSSGWPIAAGRCCCWPPPPRWSPPPSPASRCWRTGPQTFMGSAARFVAQFFPLFLLGALFGKLMEDSGSVGAIARWMTQQLGAAARHPGGGAGRRGRHLWRRQPVRRRSSCWRRWRLRCSARPASRAA